MIEAAMGSTGKRAWHGEAEAALRGARTPVRRDVPLARKTSFGVGGPARIFLAPETIGDLADAVARLARAGVPFDWLGAGSNLLVADAGPSFAVIATEWLADDPAIAKETVRVAAGYSVPKLVKRVQAAGLAGIEFAEGIPASVGGAVRMNAGWHEGMFGRAVASITAVTRQGTIETIAVTGDTFGYRCSPGLGDRCVVEADLRLIPDDPKRVQDRVLEYRRHRVATQPTAAKNAGCVFKNPPGDHAGRLIDACGLKGTSVGAAVVSEIHANFIINRGGATCGDIRRLIETIRDTVRERTGVVLEQEVVSWS
jgi:UDP-N-acetylmuramate dehydrogenase